jgi:hypothetical protein
MLSPCARMRSRHASPTRGTTVPSHPDWIHEVKQDGFRLIVQWKGDRVDGIHLAPFEQGEIGPDLFRAACDMMLEGLVSKRRDSRYRSGRTLANAVAPGCPARSAIRPAKRIRHGCRKALSLLLKGTAPSHIICGTWQGAVQARLCDGRPDEPTVGKPDCSRSQWGSGLLSNDPRGSRYSSTESYRY